MLVVAKSLIQGIQAYEDRRAMRTQYTQLSGTQQDDGAPPHERHQVAEHLDTPRMSAGDRPTVSFADTHSVM